jgi:hypothetical protein
MNPPSPPAPSGSTLAGRGGRRIIPGGWSARVPGAGEGTGGRLEARYPEAQ